MTNPKSDMQGTAVSSHTCSKDNAEDRIAEATNTDAITTDPPVVEPGSSQTVPTQKDESTPSKRTKALSIIKWFLKDQWFLLAITIITYLAVSVIFFINGCTLDTALLLANYKRWKLHIFVQLQCYLVCSAATFAIVSLCATNRNFMDPWLLIGFLFVGIGDWAVFVSVSYADYTADVSFDGFVVQQGVAARDWVWWHLQTCVYAVGALAVSADATGTDCPAAVAEDDQEGVFEWNLLKLSSIALLTMVWQTFDQAFSSGAFDAVKPSNIVFIVFITISLYLVWLAICFTAATLWLPKKDVIACCYCCPAKALAMVVPLTSVMYINIDPVDQSKMQIPAIIFQAFQVAIGGMMTIGFRRWIRPEEEREEAEKQVERGGGVK
ncbi:hypothetical protein P3342_011076 [Pyrenophora teres f. teres]|nr:hypothetical protein P3342_011076 [Pyrenophora teres f. teres]